MHVGLESYEQYQYGSTDAYNDLWFAGYTPDIYTCAYGAGFDNNKTSEEIEISIRTSEEGHDPYS